MKPTQVKVVAAALVEDPEGLILLRRSRNFDGLEQGEGLWEPPGGTVEPGEQIEAAMRREMREETSIEVPGAARIVTVVNYMLKSPGKSAHRFHVLYALRLDHVAQPVLGEEHDAFLHVRTRAELDSLEMISELREFLRDHLASRPSS